MKKCFRKLQPRIISYRSYKNFYNEKFQKDLKRKVARQVFVNNDDSFQRFCDINIDILNKHASHQKIYI